MSPPFAFAKRAESRKNQGALMLVLNPLAVADLAFVDPERKSTLGVDADPRLEENGCALLAVV